MADNPFRQAMTPGNGNPFRAALDQMTTAQAEPVPTAKGVLGSFLQGVTFGFADEGAAGLRALVSREEGEDFETAYFRHRDYLRGQLDQFREQSPVTSMGSEIGGALVPGLGTASLAGRFISGGASAATRIGRAATLGAAEGGVYGAGTAGEVGDIPGSAATGAAIGGAVGGAVPLAVQGSRAVMGAGRAGVAPSFGADFRIAQAMANDGLSPDEIARRLTEARRLGRPATMADVGGKNMATTLEVAAQREGPGSELVETFMTARNQDQLSRLSKDLVRGTGAPAEDVLSAIDRTMKTRREAAAPIYERAMQFQAEMNEEIVAAYNRTIATPIGKQAMAKARRILNIENFDEAPLMQRLDAVKRGVDDVIESAKRKGENQIARAATRMKRELVDAADAANPTYRQAREIWENGSSYLDSIDSGRNILAPKNTAAAVQREWAELTESQREAYRIGAVDAIITRMRQQSAKEPNLLKIIRSPEIRDKLQVIMQPAQWQKMERILDIEDRMREVGDQALRNSATARRQAAMEAQNRQLTLIAALGTALDLVTVGLKPLVMRGIPYMTNATRDVLLSRQNAEIARRLLSQAPSATTTAARTAAPSFGGPGVAAAIAPSVAATVGNGE